MGNVALFDDVQLLLFLILQMQFRITIGTINGTISLKLSREFLLRNLELRNVAHFLHTLCNISKFLNGDTVLQ